LDEIHNFLRRADARGSANIRVYRSHVNVLESSPETLRSICEVTLLKRPTKYNKCRTKVFESHTQG